jgi:hypothetical protein
MKCIGYEEIWLRWVNLPGSGYTSEAKSRTDYKSRPRREEFSQPTASLLFDKTEQHKIVNIYDGRNREEPQGYDANSEGEGSLALSLYHVFDCSF